MKHLDDLEQDFRATKDYRRQRKKARSDSPSTSTSPKSLSLEPLSPDSHYYGSSPLRSQWSSEEMLGIGDKTSTPTTIMQHKHTTLNPQFFPPTVTPKPYLRIMTHMAVGTNVQNVLLYFSAKMTLLTNKQIIEILI